MAVIAMARQRRLIDSARAVFAELHANDFRIAPAVIQAVLERCDERELAHRLDTALVMDTLNRDQGHRRVEPEQLKTCPRNRGNSRH